MSFYDRLAPTLIGVSVALVQAQVAVALSPEDVSKIAKEVTVLIESQKGRYGSGVIIKHVGNTYTILTAAHVVDVADNYEIITADSQDYKLNYSSVKRLLGVDLAVAEFTSNRNYTVAKLGNSDSSTEGTNIYVSGYPAPTFAIDQPIYTFTSGDLTANARKALRDGYALVYSNKTKPGMSGGAVLNNNGDLIGIHGRADAKTDNTSTGFNLGIPINTYLRISGISAPKTPVATSPKAADLFLQGGYRDQERDYKGAISAYTGAIRLNPKYADAYIRRGNARKESGDNKGAIADFDQVLRINPKYADAYIRRGNARKESGDNKGAIADFDQALRINPKYADAYIRRGNARRESGDLQGAIADFNQALLIDPDLVAAYRNRILFRKESGDLQGAIADFNQVLRIDPNDANAYYNRGEVRKESGDLQGAITDFNQALHIKPSLAGANAYYQRGEARKESGNVQEAIADFNKALLINPNLAQVYYNRGEARKESGDLQEAIADFNQALLINPNSAQAYYQRGNARKESGDLQGAIADFNKALLINSNYAYAYYNRSHARKESGDLQGAIADLLKAANLFRQNIKTDDY